MASLGLRGASRGISIASPGGDRDSIWSIRLGFLPNIQEARRIRPLKGSSFVEGAGTCPNIVAKR
jgi:hypothetical protein